MNNTPGGGDRPVNMAPAAATPTACETAGSWRARNDLAFDEVPGAPNFASTLNGLVRASTDSPIAVSNHQDVHCAWLVAFSASDGVATAVAPAHAATFTSMFQSGQSLWTTAPQTSGWIRIVDAKATPLWIPVAQVTGSASYQGGCNSFSSAEASAQIPAEAGGLVLATAEGTTTLSSLLGNEPTQGMGWPVHFTFSADLITTK